MYTQRVKVTTILFLAVKLGDGVALDSCTRNPVNLIPILTRAKWLIIRRTLTWKIRKIGNLMTTKFDLQFA